MPNYSFNPNNTRKYNISSPDKYPNAYIDPNHALQNPYSNPKTRRRTLNKYPSNKGIGPGSQGFANMITLAMILGVCGVIVAYILFRV